MAAELTASRNGDWSPTAATDPDMPLPAEAKTVVRSKDDDVPQRVKSFVYAGRELGIPFVSVLGVFGLLIALFVWVMIPQNDQHIKNQEAIQANAKLQGETNSKWATIVDKLISTDARVQLQPAVENLTAQLRDVKEEIRGMRADLRELKK